jgi:hypothetical protein
LTLNQPNYLFPNAFKLLMALVNVFVMRAANARSWSIAKSRSVGVIKKIRGPFGPRKKHNSE